MQKTKVGSSEIWVGANGVVYVRNTEKNATHTLEAAKASIAAIERMLGPNVKRPMILDLTIPLKTTGEAQSFYASPESGDTITAMAMITPSTLARVIGNLMLGATREALPMKLFETEEQALEWLREYPGS